MIEEMFTPSPRLDGGTVIAEWLNSILLKEQRVDNKNAVRIIDWHFSSSGKEQSQVIAHVIVEAEDTPHRR